jgi:Amt family ammonium transporter
MTRHRWAALAALLLIAGGVWMVAPGVFAEEAAADVVEEVAAVVQEEAPPVTAMDAMFTANNIWMMVATFLVFIMHLGFATLETGLTRAKNTVNILFKNTAIISLGLLTYAFVGFNLMYPGEFSMIPGVLGFAGFAIDPGEAGQTIEYVGGGYTYWTDFLFQGMFAATAATIVSGAVAERIKLLPFIIFSLLFVGIIYPFAGSWKWGGGFLDELGFYDFAGSTLVHSVGGWGALAGVLVLGPRIGKYVNGQTKAIAGHSMPLATIGVFLLWLGWFGFNGGSVLSGDPDLVSLVLVTTSLAAAAGIIGAMVTTWIVQNKPDLSMVLNGALAGLVGITAGADVVGVYEAMLIGFIAGIIVVFAVLGFDRIKIDDPVGAISVHLVCGVWGTLAAGIFGTGMSVVSQVIGIGAYAAIAFPSALIFFLALKYSPLGLRVTAKEEIGGLDVGEHGMEAYSGFQIFTTT